VDARARWQALQAHLTSARAAIDAGDRAKAVAEINAALAIDPAFLAAHALRDRLRAAPPVTSPSATAADRLSPPAAAPPRRGAPMADAYLMFEERARRRRVDRRLDAARAALAQQRLTAAAAALDEVIDLDPRLPELGELTAQFDDLRRAIAAPRRGRWVVAASVFAATLLGATWVHDTASIASRPMVAATVLPASPLPHLALPAAAEPVGTSGEEDHERAEPASPILGVLSDPAPEPARIRPVAPESQPLVLRAPSAPVESPPPVAEVPRPLSEAAPIAPPVAPAPPAVLPPAPPAPAPAPPAASPAPPARESVDDTALVNEALRRYRAAYDRLDAQSARAVWPAVNEAALARAFDGLQSQTLTFDACDVRLYSGTATATCRGTARYVPRFGSREPRVESRVWAFTLRRAGSGWTIDSARVER
jgi:hypothetical protein